MDTAPTPLFLRILTDRRDHFNALFAEARHHWPKLEAERFSAHVKNTLAPLAAAVEAARPERLPEVVEALYSLSLDLVARDFLGPNSRYPYLVEGWRALLPRLARFVAEDPRGFSAAVTNALFNLSAAAGARPNDWAAALLSLGEICPDAATLLKAGQVAAWRAGLAHYRLDALELCTALPPAVGRLALGLPVANAPLTPLLDRLALDPWLRPDQPPGGQTKLRIVARVGGFRGLGGPFITPPWVARHADRLVVGDDESVWELAADVFGATFHRIDLPEDTALPLAKTGYELSAAGQVKRGSLKASLPELAGFRSAAADAHTLAVALPLSHRLCLVAAVEAG